jgi:uncharacterized protein (DUF1015 family)
VRPRRHAQGRAGGGRIANPETITRWSALLRDKWLYVLDGHHRSETMVASCSRRVDGASRPDRRYGLMFLVSNQIRRGDGQLAVIMRPPTLAQLQRVADAGQVMPQKSTYFFPKLASGLVMMPAE